MIRNATRDTVLATEEVWATSAADRMRGLLDRDGLNQGEALVISPCNSVHTIGMSFPLDIVFAKKDGTVVRAISNLRPNRATRIYLTARHTIELPVGVIEASNTCKGDRLTWDPPA